ncbi:MAG: hypothetical protein GC179_15565 [Anaerolineaceae bacterium]|nr:hypothetical protein [Anaerolineaceae bacterium]
MSKRKNRNQSPNIPQSTLDRARQQLGQAADEGPVESAPEVKTEKVVQAAAKAEPGVTARPAAERRARPARTGTSTTRAPRSTSRKDDKHDISYIRARLANPTRIVTEADLKAEYGYVIKDLRAMGILATVLVLALVVIEKII